MSGLTPILAQVDIAGAIVLVLVVWSLGSVALSIGICKCWSIARRPTTNTKCVMALMLLLSAWLIQFVGNGLAVFIRSIPFGEIVSYAVFAIVVAAGVLAVVALREYSRERGRYYQGKSQALWTLAFSALAIALPILAAVEERWNILGARSPAPAPKILVFDDLNFKFFPPGGPWIQGRRNTLTPDASVTLTSLRPEMHFIVAAQRAPYENFSVDELANAAMEELRSAVDSVQVVYRGQLSRPPLPGALRLDSEADRAGQKLYYQHRLLATNGWSYQLITWGPHQNRDTIARESELLARCFEIMDSGRDPEATPKD